MKITTVLGLLIEAHFILVLLGLPVDRELFRVKRKGETEMGHVVQFVKKVRRSQDDKEIAIRHKRRFFASATTEHKTDQVYNTKMEARSSRSAREDNDVTARRPERFRVRIRKRSPAEDGGSLVTGESSGSGQQPGESFSSGSGLWSSKFIGPELESKRNDKRSMGTSSLESLISALTAISSLTSNGQGTPGEEVESSASGLWLAPEKEVNDDKLPRFFQQEGNSGSGEDPEEALSMISDEAQKESDKKEEDTGGSEKMHHETEEGLFRRARELKSDSLADDLMAAIKNDKEIHDSEPEDNVNLSPGSKMQEQEDQSTEIPKHDQISRQREENQFTAQPKVKNRQKVQATAEVKTSSEIRALRSLTDVLLPDSLHRAKRSSQENFFLLSDNTLGENDALRSDSLVARFYRDQDAHADAPEVIEASAASLPSEIEAVFNAKAKPLKRETYYEHSGDFSEPRVVYTREIRNAPEPIIERPAVYSRNGDEIEMDSSFGGEDDDDEATLTIHEREIREDGYVGCFEDKSPDRDLPMVLSVPRLTPDSCRSACQGVGHAYAGVQYGYLCRCGDSYGKYNKVPDDECDALCSGDKAQKCGGFWRSAIFTTAGAMQPSKRGNFFHIDSVQPMTEDIFDMPRSEIPSGDEQFDGSALVTESSKVSTTSPKESTPASAETMTESSGAYIQGIHRETSLQESPVPSTSGVTVQESPLPSSTVENTPKYDIVAHTSGYMPASNPMHAHDLMSSSATMVSSQADQRSDIDTTPQKVTVPLVLPANQYPERIAHSQHDQAPQGTHVSQLVYLHQQQDILSKPTPKTIVAVPPRKVKAGTVAYSGTIKLKQSWLDQFEDGNSAESKILTGNIEQAFKRIFKNEPKFVNAEVVGFREGLVKHNPNTIRKVIVPFILTFKNGAKGIQEKLKTMVKNLGRLDDMPVYKDSLQIAEYGHSPAVEKAQTVNDTVKEKHRDGDQKRSAVNIPNGGVDPILKGIFSQISS